MMLTWIRNTGAIFLGLLAYLGGCSCDGSDGSGGPGGSGPAAGTFRFLFGSYTLAETGGNVTITVTRTGGSTGAAGVSFSTADGSATAGADYGSATGTLSWADGDSAPQTVTIPIIDDALGEGDETFTVALSIPTGGAAVGPPSTTTVTITDDDAPSSGVFQFSSATYTVGEGDGTATITITRTGGSSGAAGVTYATSDGTATGGADYTPTLGSLTWNDGETASKSFTVSIIDDSISEPTETIDLALSSPTGGAGIGTTGTALLSITDNESSGTIQFASATYNVAESAGSMGVTLTVTRTGGSSGAAGVLVTIAGGTATSGLDYPQYIDWVTFLTWADGDTADKTFSVPIYEDSLVEGDETFNATLSPAMAGTVLGSPSTAVVTIIDND